MARRQVVCRASTRVLVDFGWKTAWDLERLEPNTFFPVPASVVFAERVGEIGDGVSRWRARSSAGWARQARRMSGASACSHNRHLGSAAVRLTTGYSRQGADHSSPSACYFVERNGEYRHSPGRADGDRESPARLSGQAAVARPRPDRAHTADDRGRSPLRCRTSARRWLPT